MPSRLQRSSAGKLKRNTGTGKLARDNADDSCCCGCVCGECDSAQTCGSCADCTPDQWTLTTSGITSLTGCYVCEGACSLNICPLDGSANHSSIEVAGAFANGTYTLTQGGVTPFACFWEYSSAAPVELRYYPVGVTDCSGEPCSVTGTLVIVLDRGLFGFTLEIYLEEDPSLCTGSAVAIFYGGVAEDCCTANLLMTNEYDSEATGACTPIQIGFGDPNPMALNYLAAYGGTAALTPC